MQLEHDHSPEAIAERLKRGPKINCLRDWVYGGIDGAITTFAIVAGVVGADPSSRIVLILGVANLLAVGFSMAAANYSGTKTEIDDYKRVRQMEERHIRLHPEGEKEEIRQIYRAKGFEGEKLERMVDLVVSRKDHWIDTMISEEHGMALAQRSPVVAGWTIFWGPIYLTSRRPPSFICHGNHSYLIIGNTLSILIQNKLTIGMP